MSKKLVKRCLSENEILDLLSFIPVNKGIPYEIEKERINRIKQNIVKQFKDKEVYIAILPKLKKEMERMFHKARLHPGESIGTLVATFIGEIQMQLTLSAFHFTGLSTFSVAAGVPRFLEILDVCKNQKQPSATLVFVEDYNVNIKYSLSRKLKEIVLKDIVSDIDVKFYRKFTEEEIDWYDMYFMLYDKTIEDAWTESGYDWRKNDEKENEGDDEKEEKEEIDNSFAWSIRIYVSTTKLYTYSMTLRDVVNKIQTFRDIYCVCSPDNIGIIDIYPDSSNVITPELVNENDINLTPHITDDNKMYHYINDFVIPYLFNFKISGIDDIKEVHFRKEGDKWISETEGSNLRELFNVEFLDWTKTICNNPIEIFNVLGIEAARTILIKEITNILLFGGFIVPSCIWLLADAMTFGGKLSPVNRYGAELNLDPFALASNEMPFDNLVNAIGKTDTLKCISSAITTGNLGYMGTGMFKLFTNNKTFSPSVKEKYNLLECLDKNFKKEEKKNEKNEKRREISIIIDKSKKMKSPKKSPRKSPKSGNISDEFSSETESPNSASSSPMVRGKKKRSK
jgi:DNA-directed RNA polymerase II subunit RPB1